MALPGSRVKICCDVDEAASARVEATYPGSKTTTDYTRMLDDDEISAIVVSSPASLHYEHARSAIESNKHVFVEKPIAMMCHRRSSWSGLPRNVSVF